MRLHTLFLVLIAFLVMLCASAPMVIAGADDPSQASCEILQAQGIPIFGDVAVSLDFTTSLAAATFKTVAVTRQFVVIRVLVGLDTGTSVMENVCQILHGVTAEGGATLAQQILTAVGLPNRTIKITKRGIFGCDALPCSNPGLRPDFALVPGTDIATSLGVVSLFAVRP